MLTAAVQAIKDPETGRPQYWEPQYLFDNSDPTLNKTVSGCVPTEVPLPRTLPNGAGFANNTASMYGKAVPCVDNTQVGPSLMCQLTALHSIENKHGQLLDVQVQTKIAAAGGTGLQLCNRTAATELSASFAVHLGHPCTPEFSCNMT